MNRYLLAFACAAFLAGCGSSVKLDDVPVQDKTGVPVAGQGGAAGAAGAAGSTGALRDAQGEKKEGEFKADERQNEPGISQQKTRSGEQARKKDSADQAAGGSQGE